MPTGLVMVAVAGLLLLQMVELYLHAGRRLSGSHSDADDPDSDPVYRTNRGVSAGNLIITHTDFDGFTSGALLLRLLRKNTAIMFSSPGTLLKNLKRAGAELIAGDSIHIADLAMQPHLEHEFVDVLSDLKDRGVNVHWFDHHEWPAGLMQRINLLCHEFVIAAAEKTAAAIIRRRLPEHDDQADRLLSFVQNRSVGQDKEWDQRWRMVLTELGHRRDPELSETVLRAWAEDEASGALLSFLARQGELREAATRSIAAHQHRRESTTHHRNFLVIDVRPRRLERDVNGRKLYVITRMQPSMMVGIEACRMQQGDFCLIVWDDFRFSVYRGIDPDVEFSALFGQRNIEGFQYRIGGHHYAVSVRMIPGIGGRVRALFRWRLGPEAETFIKALQEHY